MTGEFSQWAWVGNFDLLANERGSLNISVDHPAHAPITINSTKAILLALLKSRATTPRTWSIQRNLEEIIINC